jgi:osmotically-inducible protein OsmY
MVNPMPSDPQDVELENLIIRRIRDMGADIHVHVKGGHVSLSGIADNYSDKRDIVAIVKDIGGVRDVTSDIRVAPIAD